MKKKGFKVNVYLQIIIAVLLVLISGVTYAYFSASNDIESTTNLTAQTGTAFSFVSSSSSDIEINVTGFDMQESKIGNYVSSGNGTIKVDLKSPSNLATTCTYDLLFTYTSENKYLEPSIELPYSEDGKDYPYEFSLVISDSETGEIIFEERDLSKVNAGRGFTEKDGIYSGTIAENLSIKAEKEHVSKTYNIEARIYNLPVNQPNLLNKYMTGKIKVDNLNCVYDNASSEEVMLYEMMANNSQNDSSINFEDSPTETSGTGIFLRDSTKNDQYPVYYYRGMVENNNVLFDNFCWKIVRTTSTGGIKMIYNGIPSDDGSCNGIDISIAPQRTKFTDYSTSPADVGYMFGKRFEYSKENMTNQNDTYIYSNDVEYKDGVYTLIDTYSSNKWSNDLYSLASKYHYTCFGSNNICNGKVYYIHYFGDSSYAYYLTLEGEKNIEEVKEKMFANEKNSIVKYIIDDWYEKNIKDKENMLEDTIWCNDRKIISGPLKSKDENSTGTNIFASYERLIKKPHNPTFDCDKKDSFTKDDIVNGNGALDNPVGLLTADEYVLSGARWDGLSSETYLKNGYNQWTMTPYYFNYNLATNLAYEGTGNIYLHSVSGIYNNVSPSISLKPGTISFDGNGSTSRPFIIN